MTEHPDLPGTLTNEVADSPAAWSVNNVDTVYSSSYLRVYSETIVGPDSVEHERVVVRPNGAVAVLAIDAEDRALVLEQYRHPVGARMIELPAGTLDVAGEEPVEAAKRELGEEADLQAEVWEEQLKTASTPGYSSEYRTVFVARQLSPLPVDQRTPREAEEAEIRSWWVPFDRLVELVLNGQVKDSLTATAVLAEAVRRR